MPLEYIDFVPKLLEARDPYSTLALTGDKIGPKYESFDQLVVRANAWLKENCTYFPTGIECFEVEGSYRCGAEITLANGTSGGSDLLKGFLKVLRLWVSEHTNNRVSYSSNQFSYLNVMPLRLESTPRAFAPKFQTLSETLDTFNKSWEQDPDIVPGKILKIQTSTCRFSAKHCSIDPKRTFWLVNDPESVQYCFFFQIFFLLDPEQHPCRIGFKDFAPNYTLKDKRRKLATSENVNVLINRAQDWFNTTTGLKYANMQIVDHPTYFKTLVDMPGQENLKLESPHAVTNHHSTIYHTKLVRLFYLRDIYGNKDTPSLHTKLKVFHAPNMRLTSQLMLGSGIEDVHIAHDGTRSVVVKAQRWAFSRGLKPCSFETVVCSTNNTKGKSSGESTHFESHGRCPTCCFMAVYMFVETYNNVPFKNTDFHAEPKYVPNGHMGCCIL